MRHLTTILIPLFCGLLGAFIHFYFKYNSLRKLARTAGEQSKLTFSSYWRDDYPSLVCSCLTVLAYVFVLGEIAQQYPVVAKWARISSILAGWLGQRGLQSVLGGAEKYILKLVDIKTNIADKVIARGLPDNEVNEDIHDDVKQLEAAKANKS